MSGQNIEIKEIFRLQGFSSLRQQFMIQLFIFIVVNELIFKVLYLSMRRNQLDCLQEELVLMLLLHDQQQRHLWGKSSNRFSIRCQLFQKRSFLWKTLSISWISRMAVGVYSLYTYRPIQYRKFKLKLTQLIGGSVTESGNKLGIINISWNSIVLKNVLWKRCVFCVISVDDLICSFLVSEIDTK